MHKIIKTYQRRAIELTLAKQTQWVWGFFGTDVFVWSVKATMNNENDIGRKQPYWVLIIREIASISQEPTGFASKQANLVSGDKERSASYWC